MATARNSRICAMATSRSYVQRRHVDSTLVCEVEEDVARRGGGRALLLGTKDEVDPLVERCRDEVGFECGAWCARMCGTLCPRRQHNVVDALACLPDAQVELLAFAYSPAGSRPR